MFKYHHVLSYFTSECTFNYTKTDQSKVNTGTPDTSASDEAGCKAACSADPACRGFDLATSTTGITSCWLIKNDNAIIVSGGENVVHYQLIGVSCKSDGECGRNLVLIFDYALLKYNFLNPFCIAQKRMINNVYF